MNLELTEEAALERELRRIIDDDRYRYQPHSDQTSF
jgi:hypothetical protein